MQARVVSLLASLVCLAGVSCAPATLSASRADSSSASSPGSPRCARPWLFFDLGNTLIDTRDAGAITHMAGSSAYLAALRAKGYKLGLIANIPEDWGVDYASKLARTKAEIALTWAEATPFEWETFDKILLPMKTANRKPAPDLFIEALRVAAPCHVIYQGEDPREIAAANLAGMRGSLVPHADGAFYLPEAEF